MYFGTWLSIRELTPLTASALIRFTLSVGESKEIDKLTPLLINGNLLIVSYANLWRLSYQDDSQ